MARYGFAGHDLTASGPTISADRRDTASESPVSAGRSGTTERVPWPGPGDDVGDRALEDRWRRRGRPLRGGHSLTVRDGIDGTLRWLPAPQQVGQASFEAGAELRRCRNPLNPVIAAEELFG